MEPTIFEKLGLTMVVDGKIEYAWIETHDPRRWLTTQAMNARERLSDVLDQQVGQPAEHRSAQALRSAKRDAKGRSGSHAGGRGTFGHLGGAREDPGQSNLSMG